MDNTISDVDRRSGSREGRNECAAGSAWTEVETRALVQSDSPSRADDSRVARPRNFTQISFSFGRQFLFKEKIHLRPPIVAIIPILSLFRTHFRKHRGLFLLERKNERDSAREFLPPSPVYRRKLVIYQQAVQPRPLNESRS